VTLKREGHSSGKTTDMSEKSANLTGGQGGLGGNSPKDSCGMASPGKGSEGCPLQKKKKPPAAVITKVVAISERNPTVLSPPDGTALSRENPQKNTPLWRQLPEKTLIGGEGKLNRGESHVGSNASLQKRMCTLLVKGEVHNIRKSSRFILRKKLELTPTGRGGKGHQFCRLTRTSIAGIVSRVERGEKIHRLFWKRTSPHRSEFQG